MHFTFLDPLRLPSTTAAANLHRFLASLLQSPHLGPRRRPTFLTNTGHLPFLSQIHPLLRPPCHLPPSPATPRTSPATGVPSQVSLCPPTAHPSSPPARAPARLPEGKGQAGTPESADEKPTADGPEEADAILAAPSPSPASLPFNRALPLLRVESSPRLLTEPAFRGPPADALRGPSQTRRAGSRAGSQPHGSAGMGDDTRLAPSP